MGQCVWRAVEKAYVEGRRGRVQPPARNGRFPHVPPIRPELHAQRAIRLNESGASRPEHYSAFGPEPNPYRTVAVHAGRRPLPGCRVSVRQRHRAVVRRANCARCFFWPFYKQDGGQACVTDSPRHLPAAFGRKNQLTTPLVRLASRYGWRISGENTFNFKRRSLSMQSASFDREATDVVHIHVRPPNEPDSDRAVIADGRVPCARNIACALRPHPGPHPAIAEPAVRRPPARGRVPVGQGHRALSRHGQRCGAG